MKLTSVFKAPEGSVTVGIAEAAAVYGIYNASIPNMTDIRSADPHNPDVESMRKAAAWKSFGLLSLVFLITQDMNSFLIGSAALAGIDLMAKHANGVNPGTGKLAGKPAAGDVSVDPNFALPDYADTSDEDGGY